MAFVLTVMRDLRVRVVVESVDLTGLGLIWTRYLDFSIRANLFLQILTIQIAVKYSYSFNWS